MALAEVPGLIVIIRPNGAEVKQKLTSKHNNINQLWHAPCNRD